MIGQCCNFHGINSMVEISWDIFRILANHCLRHLVNNVAIHMITLEWRKLYCIWIFHCINCRLNGRKYPFTGSANTSPVNSICDHQISNWCHEIFKYNSYLLILSPQIKINIIWCYVPNTIAFPLLVLEIFICFNFSFAAYTIVWIPRLTKYYSMYNNCQSKSPHHC